MEQLLLKDKNVLVVEDNSINQFVVNHCLLNLGAIPDIVNDGLEAIDKVQANNYDLILMDIQMPEMDGYDTTVYIRNQLNSTVPIIAMTAFALQGEDKKCFESGMDGYVAKPFSQETLAAAIEKVISSPKEIIKNPYILGTSNVLVDISMLYDVSGNDIAYIQKMVSTFLENMHPTIKKMELHLNEQDYDNLYKIAHYAKSSLSIIKISDVREQVEKIEKSAKRKTDLPAIGPLLKQVKEKFELAEQLLLQKFASIEK